ncbi:MAG: VCBS repeat-containing protein [Myxococcota bacterium]
MGRWFAVVWAAGCADPGWHLRSETLAESPSTVPVGGVWARSGPVALSGGPATPIELGEGCGYTVVAAGDIDQDGVPDVAVGCGDEDLRYLSGNQLGGGAVEEVGAVSVRAGFLRESVLSLGDLDGDGRDEIGVEEFWTGAWGLVLAGSDVAGASSVTDREIGWSLWADADHEPTIGVSPAGDYDGDGFPDVAIAAMASSGMDSRLYIGSGAALAGLATGGSIDLARDALATFTVDVSLGPVRRVSSPGDLDGDGLDELAVSLLQTDGFASPEGASPEVRIVRGGTASGRLDDATVITAVNVFARDVDGVVTPVGDVDGDGRDELVVTLSGFSSSEDQWHGVAVLSGADVPVSGSVDVAGHLLADADLGRTTACDLDGDGAPELVTAHGIFRRADLLTPGAPPIATIDVPGALTCAGDLDGDGASDLVLGDPWLGPSLGDARVGPAGRTGYQLWP